MLVCAGETISEEYITEYSTDKIEMHTGAIEAGQRVLLVSKGVQAVHRLQCGRIRPGRQWRDAGPCWLTWVGGAGQLRQLGGEGAVSSRGGRSGQGATAAAEAVVT